MRTVTFAKAKVIDFVAENFVAVWDNTREGQACGEPFKGSIDGVAEGQGAGIFALIVAKPDGTVVHAIEGFWGSPTVLAELEYALKLAKADDPKPLGDEHGKKLEKAESDALRGAHEPFEKWVGRPVEELLAARRQSASKKG